MKFKRGFGVLGFWGFGGSSSSSTSSTDTTAPSVLSMTSLASAKTVTLVFSESLDATNLPLTTNFSVTVGGVQNQVASISVSGSTLVLTLTNTFTTGALVNVTYVDDAGNQTTTIQDAAGNDALGFVVGKAADGYISGAQIYLDANGDGIAQDSEILAGVTTDSEGNFFLKSGDNPSNFALILEGGTNIDTGLANTIQLKAPAGSTSITPLTTILQTMMAESGLSLEDANAKIVTALGLEAGTDLSKYDPISIATAGSADDAAFALTAQKAAAQIAAILTLASSGDTSIAATLMINLASEMASATGQLDLTDGDRLLRIYSGVTVDADVQEKIAANVLQISTVTSLTELTDVQQQSASEYVDIADVIAKSDAGSMYDIDDAITLEVSTGDGVSDDISTDGSYLTGSLDDAISDATSSAVIGGLSLSELGDLGVDLIDLDGFTTSTTLHIDSDDANALSEAGLAFASGDNILLDINTSAFGDDLEDAGSGSYLSVSLDDAISGATGLSLSQLGDLGIDQIDLNGIGSVTFAINGEDASDLYSSDLSFASGDNISLDIGSSVDIDAYLTDSSGTESTGSFLSGSLDDAISDITGLSLSQLVSLGIDQISLAGDTLYVDSSDVSAMSDAGLTYDSNDNIAMLAMDASDEAVGSYLSTSLDDFDNLGVDAVVTAESATFINLGDSISDFDDLAALLDSLIDNLIVESFVVDETTNDTTTSLIVSADQFGDNNADIETVFTDGNLAKLSSIGIDNVYYANSEGDASLAGIGLEDNYTNITTT